MQNVLVDGVSTFHLQVEEGEATSPTDICLRQRQFLWRGFGLAAGLVMLLGASALPIHSLAAPADAPSGSTNTAAFIHANSPLSYLPAVPRLRKGRHDSRTPLPRMQPTPLFVEMQNRYPTQLNVIGLKQLLKERGLSVSGNKAELITRLETFEDAVYDSTGKEWMHRSYAERLACGLVRLTVPELKVLLKEKGLPVSGKKAELITRLEISTEQQDLRSQIEIEMKINDREQISHKTRVRAAKCKIGSSMLTVQDMMLLVLMR